MTAPEQPQEGDQATRALRGRHQKLGWVVLLVAATSGLVLESLVGFRVAAYVDFTAAPRRELWTLAHAHGTLLGALNLIYAALLPTMFQGRDRARSLASLGLVTAAVAMPLGFFLGGAFLIGNDPGLAIVMVPLGGAALVLALSLCASDAFRRAPAR